MHATKGNEIHRGKKERKRRSLVKLQKEKENNDKQNTKIKKEENESG